MAPHSEMAEGKVNGIEFMDALYFVNASSSEEFEAQVGTYFKGRAVVERIGDGEFSDGR